MGPGDSAGRGPNENDPAREAPRWDGLEATLWFPGKPVHELIRDNRLKYCQLLKDTDKTMDENNMADLGPIEAFIERLLDEQMDSVKAT